VVDGVENGGRDVGYMFPALPAAQAVSGAEVRDCNHSCPPRLAAGDFHIVDASAGVLSLSNHGTSL